MRKEVKLVRGTPIPRKKKIMLGTTVIEVYSIGWFAFFSKLSIQTLRLWETKRILPKPILAVPGGRRMYSASEVKQYSAAIENHYSGTRNLADLTHTLRKLSVRLTHQLKQYSSGTPVPESECSLPVNNVISQVQ